MCILAIETAISSGSIGILKENKIVYQDYAEVLTTHSETIMTRIENGLKTVKIDKSDLKAVSISIGPGSFTGLRIGLATAKGISTGLRIPLIAFNTLEVLASNVLGTNQNILSILDARMKEAYIAVYDPYLNIIMESHSRGHEKITEGLVGEYICVGDITLIKNHLISKYEYNEQLEIITTDEGGRFQFALPHQNMLMAASQFSLMKYKKIKLEYDEDYIYQLEPHYVRNADVQWKQNVKPASCRANLRLALSSR
ncbi:MAG: tRNA (adenosine(37)-N6)-threonylcarbamoyltransferase complex dimerization subunit type 1 TsaB [Candidatus Cloacimonetes bacterium]|nr:tRNA (adenosine(37)-N6)-threonylcarbamoyltransferase complex dimerization subunit type 1 TsaB [Candidatus Cloacimonadota bacterium]